jgi:hypothetical protein
MESARVCRVSSGVVPLLDVDACEFSRLSAKLKLPLGEERSVDYVVQQLGSGFRILGSHLSQQVDEFPGQVAGRLEIFFRGTQRVARVVSCLLRGQLKAQSTLFGFILLRISGLHRQTGGVHKAESQFCIALRDGA